MVSPNFTPLLLFFMQLCVLSDLWSHFKGRDLFFFEEAHNGIYFVIIKSPPPHLHINQPTKKLQNYMICLFFPFCWVVVGEVGILYSQNIYYYKLPRKKRYLTLKMLFNIHIILWTKAKETRKSHRWYICELAGT